MLAVSTKNVGPMSDKWRLDKSVPDELKQQWIENGYSVIKGAYSIEQIEKYNSIVSLARKKIDDGKDEYGYGDRVGQLHQKYPDLLEMATDSRVVKFLKWAFYDDPVVFGSLNFDRGTQQEAHIDAIFFWPEPSYSMCGCWVALEDINSDAGPLFYLPGSHTWPFIHSENVISNNSQLIEKRNKARSANCSPSERAQIVAELGQVWTQSFVSLELEKNVKREPLNLKAGDVVFWHSLLAHGGMPRLNPALSRKSVVFHYIGKKTKLFTFDQFMLFDQSELYNLDPQPMRLKKYKDVEYMRYDHIVSYSNGQQIITPI